MRTGATSGAAHAQAVYGSVSGIVRDSTGALLPGATVIITSVERNTVDTVVTNESGVYLKERLLPGNYELRAELAGGKLMLNGSPADQLLGPMLAPPAAAPIPALAPGERNT